MDSGQDPIFQGATDFDLELIERRTLDGHIQELIYPGLESFSDRSQLFARLDRALVELLALHRAMFLRSSSKSPDCEETIEARCLERSHRRLRPDEDEQLAPVRLLASARAEEQTERGRVDESDQAKVDGQVGDFCQRVFDRRGTEKVELASEDENR